MQRLQILVQLHFHIVELNLHAVQQRIVVGRAGGDLVQGVDHLDNAVQDSLGNHQAQVPRRRRKGGHHEGPGDAAGRAALAPDQIPKPLDHDAAPQHVAQPGDAFAVSVAVPEGIRKGLGHQQGEVGVLRLQRRILIAVAVHRHDAVGVLRHHRSPGIHAEGPHQVLVFLGLIDDLALIHLVGNMAEDHRRQLHPHADVHPVGLGRNPEAPAHPLHPAASAPAHGGHADRGPELALRRGQDISLPGFADLAHRAAEIEIRLVLQLVIQRRQHLIVDVRPQVPHGGVQQMQIVLQAQPGQGRVRRGIQLGPRAAEAHVQLVHLPHELHGLFLADMLVKRAAKGRGDVIFPVGERSRPAEARHNGAGGTVDAVLDLLSVDGAFALFQHAAGLKHRHPQRGIPPGQFIGAENPARARANNQYVIVLQQFFPAFRVFSFILYHRNRPAATPLSFLSEAGKPRKRGSASASNRPGAAGCADEL